jgi:hypothetical protein
MVGRAHCSAEDRALIRASARDLGLFPTDSFYRPIQAAGSMFHSANGGDLKQTSGYLRHGSVDITGDTYLHIPQETERGQRRQAGKRDVSERRAESVRKC